MLLIVRAMQTGLPHNTFTDSPMIDNNYLLKPNFSTIALYLSISVFFR